MLASHPSCMLTSAVPAARERTVMKDDVAAAPRAPPYWSTRRRLSRVVCSDMLRLLDIVWTRARPTALRASAPVPARAPVPAGAVRTGPAAPSCRGDSLVGSSVRRKCRFPRPALPIRHRLGSSPPRRPAGPRLGGAGRSTITFEKLPGSRRSFRSPRFLQLPAAPASRQAGQSARSTASTNAPMRLSEAWTTCSGPGKRPSCTSATNSLKPAMRSACISSFIL